MPAGKTETDFLQARDKCLQMAEALKKKFDWIIDFRFKGDPNFYASRKKAKMRELEEAGEEISFGLNMVLTYRDKDDIVKETDIVLRHKEKPFYDFYFKAIAENPTVDDLVNQWKNTWFILYSGGTVEEPKAVVVTKFTELHKQCFVSAESKDHRGRFRISFAKWIKWVPFQQVNIFGESSDLLFERIRKDDLQRNEN